MKKIIRLTESDLVRLVKRVIKEEYNEDDGSQELPPRILRRLPILHQEINKRLENLEIASICKFNEDEFYELMRDLAFNSLYLDHFSKIDDFNEDLSVKIFEYIERNFEDKIREHHRMNCGE